MAKTTPNKKPAPAVEATLVDKFVEQFIAARRVSTPLVGVSTPDPAATIQRLVEASHESVPAIAWDTCRGWLGLNERGTAAIEEVCGNDPDRVNSMTAPPSAMLIEAAPKLPGKTVLYMVNGHRYLADQSASGAGFVQAIWNLRDQYKEDIRTLVLLGPSLTLPGELTGDVLMLDEPLPDDAALGSIVCGMLENADVRCTDEVRTQAVNALRGLAAFPAEQATAMATTKGKGLDVASLWERKRKMVSQTPGLSVWQGGETLEDVGGCANVKRYIRAIANSRTPFNTVVFIDEGEKMFGGAGSDSSGVATRYLGKFLSYQQDANDRGSSGMLFLGPPGAAKSMVAKATGATFGVPTVALDLGGMMGSLVGQSEAQLDRALKVVDAVGGGRALFIMTCNKSVSLPPELKRRYKDGTFYFDLPDAEEQEAIWSIYMRKFDIPPNAQRPPCIGWTGAEIRQACYLAWNLNMALKDTSDFIVPVAVSAKVEIEALRDQANLAFLSASYSGLYTKPKRIADASAPGKRTLASDGEV